MDGTKLYRAWLELLQTYNASLLSRRDFLKQSVRVGCGQCVRVCPTASHPDEQKALRWTENKGFRNARSMNVFAIETGVKFLGILPRVLHNRGDGNLLE